MLHIRVASRADAAGIARVHAQTWKEAYRGLLDGAFLDALSEKRLAVRWRAQLDRRRQDLDEETLVALSGREIVGFASAGASREAFAPWDAEITMVYVLKEHRGAGVGRGLMKAAADHCIRRGMFSGGVWVLRDNGAARDFYEALGGEATGRKVDSVGGQIVQLAGYYWRELSLLAERSTRASQHGRF